MLTKDVPKKLFLLDAYALIYRAYFAFSNNPRINSKGLNTSAIFGFTNTLLEVLNKEKPTHIAVVFDTAAKTQRHVDFEDYKAHREEMPDDLRKNIPYIYKLLEGFNICTMGIDGYEADDVIGSLARTAEKNGFTTYMMTPDKDYGQLVDENTFIYKPARLGNGVEILDQAAICKRWEIKNVGELIEILGLMGDSADNIPGIPGVGEKTAIKFIHEFGTIENLYKNTDKLKGKMKEKVEANQELAIMSKKLATIITDIPEVKWDEKELERKELNKEMLKELFMDLEFRNLAVKLLGEEIPSTKEIVEEQKKEKTKTASANTAQGDLFAEETETVVAEDGEEEAPKNYKTANDVPHNYILVDTAEKRKELLKVLSANKEFCYDSETTSLDTHDAEIVGMSFAVKPFEAYYVPFPESQNESQKIADEFKALFLDETKTLVGQNIKYDLEVLLNYNIEIKNKLFDTMIAHFLIQPEGRHNMNVLSQTYLNYNPIQIETLIGKGKNQTSMRMADLKAITEYAAEDADVTIQLEKIFAPRLKENKVDKLFTEVEIPLINVLADMEREGIRIDTKVLNDYSVELQKDVVKIDDEIQKLAGTAFNISSPKQVGEILFEYLKIVDKPKKTKTGQYATGEEVLIKLVDKHPIVPKILEYREVLKLKNTYVDTLPELVSKKTGRVHTSYNQEVAVTRR